MIGRLVNLIPVGVFVSSSNFHDYFLAVGIATLAAIIPFLILRRLYTNKRINVDIGQRRMPQKV